MFSSLFTKRMRMRARALSRDCHIRCHGNREQAEAMAEKRKYEVGNPILVLTIGVLILQAIYYALKIYRDRYGKGRPPIIPQPGEGFELGRGERFSLTESELQSLEVSDENW